MDRPQAGGYNIYEITLVCDRTMSLRLRAFQTVVRNGSLYLRVSAACLPNFFKSRSNVSLSFFEKFLRQVSPRPLSRRAMPTTSSDKRLRKHANFGAAASVLRPLAISARSKSDRRSPKDRWRNVMFPLDI